MSRKVLVLGGYGNFGERICRALASECALYIAGRQLDKAQTLADELGAHALALDHQAADFAQRGAMPCMRLLTVDEILTAVPGLSLRWGMIE